MDTEVDIAERVVTDFVTLFADIGGVSGFFLAFLSLLVGSIPSKLFALDSTSNLFKVNLKSVSGIHPDQLAWFSATKSPKLKFSTRIKFIFCRCFNSECVKRKRERKLERLLEIGSNKIQSMLDLR